MILKEGEQLYKWSIKRTEVRVKNRFFKDSTRIKEDIIER